MWIDAAVRVRGCRQARTGAEMGRPSPGGEEARVVVNQPRGVGLMHARPKPSEANYTHGMRPLRKHFNGCKTTYSL